MQDHILDPDLPIDVGSLLPPGLTDYDKFGWFYGVRNLTIHSVSNTYSIRISNGPG